MTCPWAPTAGGTTTQSGQRNDGVMASETQRLHQRLGHINRTLHADIEKPTSLKKNINNLQKINFYVFMKKKKCSWKNLHLIVGKTQYCDTQQTIHNKTNNIHHKIHSCYIISFEKFVSCFWRGGLFELDWFRDRRQLNSLLKATQDGCYGVWLKSPPTPPISGTTLTLTGLITASLYCFTFI